MLFRNRTAVITGAAGRIGRATSLALGKQGVKLYLADMAVDGARTAGPLNPTFKG